MVSEREEHRLRIILREELDAWGQRIGLDTSDPISLQADFRHLRRTRHLVEKAGLRAVYTLVTICVTGLVAVVVAAFNR